MVNGNISTKNNMGQYSYSTTSMPHAVNVICPIDGIPEYEQYIEYTPWNKVGYIYHAEEVDYYFYNIEYGPDQQRVRSSLYKNDVLQKKKFYWDGYEEYLYKNYNNSDVTVWSYWIEAPDGLAGFYWNSSDEYYLAIHPYVAMTDHLGSLTGLFDHNGYKTLDATYDAWGKRTFSAGSMQLDRGFTGHEHIDVLGLINMNGRMYDPLQGRFLSPDPFVQSPTNPQNYNRYSYCLNNPLKYTDPDGEFWHIVIGAAIGGAINLATNWKNCDGFWEYVAAFGVGAGAGALTAATGGAGAAWGWVGLAAAGGGAVTMATNSVIQQTGKNFNGIGIIDWKQVGIAAAIGGFSGFTGSVAGHFGAQYIGNVVINGFNVTSPVLRGAVAGAIGGAAGGYVGGFTAGMIATGDWGAANQAGLNGLWSSAAIGGLVGGGSGYFYAKNNNIDPWSGVKKNSIVIGEGMEKRVEPVAKDLGIDCLNDSSLPEAYFGDNIHSQYTTKEMMNVNAEWIESKMMSGTTIYDIGPRSSVVTSPYYNMEQARTMMYPDVIKVNTNTINISEGFKMRIISW